MTNKPAIKIVLNLNGKLEKVEIWGDSADRSLLKIYDFLSQEILDFTKKTERIIRKCRATGKVA
mgnify:CR=1 FL=1|jgi:hypothetical protein